MSKLDGFDIAVDLRIFDFPETDFFGPRSGYGHSRVPRFRKTVCRVSGRLVRC